MANNHVCLECGVPGVTKDLINRANCCEYAIHRYCMIEWPNTKCGHVSWFCGCQEHEELPNQPEFTMEHEELSNDSEFTAKEEEEVPNQRSEGEQIDFEFTDKDEEEVYNQSNSSSETFNPAEGSRKILCNGSVTGTCTEKHAEPILLSTWSGSFQIRCMYDDSDAIKPVNEITAFLSNKADEKAWDEMVQFRPVIRPEMVSKDLVWPNSFEETAPKDEDIAVYFFSSACRPELRMYNDLVFEMMMGNLAMRVDLENSEILIFTSGRIDTKVEKISE